MKTTQLAAALALVFVGACKDDSPKLQSDAPTKMDAPAPTPDGPSPATYVQVEQLGRPGINEALLRTNAYLNGYNETAPSFTGVPPATLDAVIAEAEGTLQAVYLGVCLTNGIAGLTAGSAGTGLKPAGQACPVVGANVFQEGTATGVTIAAAAGSAAAAYASLVFSQFEPDVMRIDTSKPSGYLTLCGGTAPLLCGGRNLTDDVIDITYDYLIDGANEYLNPVNPPTALSKQVIALTSDGVVFNDSAANMTNNPTSLSTPDPANFEQGHPAATATFPFSAPPI